MNEQIRELAEQASSWVGVDTKYGTDSEYELDIAKFAELIVNKCANISNQAETQCQHPGTAIKKHFGVEL